MKKFSLLLLLLMISAAITHAQTRIFPGTIVFPDLAGHARVYVDATGKLTGDDSIVLKKQFQDSLVALDTRLQSIVASAADGNTMPAANVSAYVATQAATYTNFLSAPSTPIVVSSGDLASGEVKLLRNGSYWSKVVVPVNLTNYVSKPDIYVTVTSKNLLNPANFDTLKYYSPGSNTVVSSSTNASVFTGYIPVVQGQTYTYSGAGIYNIGGYFTAGNVPVSAITWTAVVGGYKFTVPTGSGIAYVGLNYQRAVGGADLQLELGALATSFQPYFAPYQRIDNTKLATPPLAASVGQPAVDRVNDAFLLLPKKNLIDTSVWNRGQYYSPGSKTLVTSAAGGAFARTGYIPVERGGVYSYSGSGYATGNTGGYFNSQLQPVGTNVVFSGIVNGERFTVPNDTAIRYVVLNWAKQDATVPGKIQLEASEIATIWEPYQTAWKLNPSYAPMASGSSGGSSGGGTVSGSYTDIHSVKYPGVWKKFPRFAERWHSRDSDVVFAIWGTSMLARTTNTSFRADGPSRPPLADANNVFSLLVDKLQWTGQQYRRYDYTGFFAETGTYTDSYNDAAWDDGPYREGRTRFSSTAGASVQFTVPVGAWQYNFIYRTGSGGTTAATVTVAGGNGLMEAWNGTAWVEANGFVFSMLEPAATANKGNTTFGKRLKMRCKSGAIDSRATAKAVTITNTAGSGRLMYWGVEWSERRTMITFINAARGSHNFSSATTGLPLFQDNELYGFKPDFILVELPTNNEGASVSSIPNRGRSFYTGVMENWIFNPSNPQSMYSKTGGFASTEIAMFNTTASILIGSVDTATKDWIFANENTTNDKITVADVFRAVSRWAQSKDNTTAQVNLFEEMNREAIDRFGTYYGGFLGSGKTGATLSNDGTHWNDAGCRTAGKYLLPLFDFN